MKQKAEPVTSAFDIKNKPQKLIHLLLPKLVAGVLILVAVIVVIVLIDNHRKNEPRTGVCTKSMIASSAVDISQYNKTALTSDVNAIKALKNYQHDPNCMYILTTFYVREYNFKQAESSLSLFNKAYNGKNLDTILYTYLKPADLSTLVNSIRINLQQQENDARKVPESSASRLKKQ